MTLSYRNMRPDELERLAFIGDEQAQLALASSVEMVVADEAERQAAAAQEEGEEAGYRRACKRIFEMHAEAILAASNGSRDDDVCESLKQLMTFLEEQS
jgi:hypothetical protein